jgi:protease IV
MDQAASQAPEYAATLPERLLEELLTELRSDREHLRSEHRELVNERRSERRWKVIFQLLLFGGPVLFGVVYLLFFTSAMGFQWGPFGTVVGVIHIDGAITPTGAASAKRILPAIEKAFTYPNVKAVVLSIDSPGGAAVEAERIYRAIENLKRKHDKPVVAIINNVGASAAYMIAMHTDRVYCAKYSLVGSIGTMIDGWDLHKAMERLDVAQRVYASGRLKSMLSPFLPMSKEADDKARQLVDQGGAMFVADLKATRGRLLKSSIEYGSGEIWAGEEAKAIGLVDEIATLDEVIAATWAIKPYDFGPDQDSFGPWSSTFQGFAQALADALLARLSPQFR